MAGYPATLIKLSRLVEEQGGILYAVGGQVRNPLLGLPISDRDVTSRLTPDTVISIAKREGIRVIEKGIAFGTVELHMGPDSYEHTTFRSDSYGEGGGHRPENVRFSKSLEEDAFRRDFTVNALYQNVLTGEIADPTGGLADIRARLIRATNPDPGVIMRDDALRILRMVRFACELGFDIEPATFASAKNNVQGLSDISCERIRDELNKILLSDARYGMRGGCLKGLKLLDGLGALDIILPELTRGRGLSQKKQYHAHDVLLHSLNTAQETPPDLTLRLAGLLHDVGKPVVREATGRMLNHDIAGEPIAREILTRLRYPNSVTRDVCELVLHHMYDLTGRAKDSTLREKFALMGYDTALRLCDIREADVHGSGIITGPVETSERWRDILARMKAEGAPFSQSELCCTGADIQRWLSLPPGERIGEIKQRLFLHCARKPQDNTQERLKKLAKDMMKK